MTQRRVGSPLFRLLGIAAVVLLASGSVAGFRHDLRARQAAETRLQESELATRHPDLGNRLAEEPDRVRAQLLLDRSVLGDALDARWIAGLPPEQAAAAATRLRRSLEAAERRAAALLVRRPAAWEAATVVAGARFLRRWRSGDPGSLAGPGSWERPLRAARHLAPGRPEPERLAATFYLASWMALPEGRRRETRDLLATSFRDPATLDRLLPLWLRIEPNPEAQVAVLPDQPRTWERLTGIHQARGEWRAFCSTRERLMAARRRELEAGITEARQLLAGGRARDGRNRLLTLAAGASPRHSLADLFAKAMMAVPPGPVSDRYASGLGRWHDWSLELWQRDLPALPPEVVRRLAAMLDGLSPPVRALSALAGADLAAAEAVERRAGPSTGEAWDAYLTAKARILAARGERRTAEQALALVSSFWHRRWSFLAAQASLGLEEGPRSLASDRWPKRAWQRRAEGAELEIFTDRPASGLRVAAASPPPAGGALEIFVDGAAAGCYPLEAGRSVMVERKLPPGVHLLEARPLAGAKAGSFDPGMVELLDSSHGSTGPG